MSNQCINYKFCKGIAFPEIEEDTCLLCGRWYNDGEGWGKLEFTEIPEECAVCYKIDILMKFPTNCGHQFCIYCSRNLLYFQNDIYDICPIKYGCPPCKHFGESNKSCRTRPCCDEDQLILDKWEEEDYNNFIEWNYDEFNNINEERNYLITKKCPFCRKVYERTVKY